MTSVEQAVPATPAGIFEWQRALRGRVPARYMPVAFCLAIYANRDGSSVHPGIARLMHDTGQSRATVVRCLAWLEAEGWITCVTRGGAGSGRKGMANLYQLSEPSKAVLTGEQAVLTGEHPPAQLSPSSSLKRVQPPVGRPPNINDDDYNSQDAYDWIDEQVHGLDGYEPTYVDARLSRGDHPKAIVNGLHSQREAA